MYSNTKLGYKRKLYGENNWTQRRFESGILAPYEYFEYRYLSSTSTTGIVRRADIMVAPLHTVICGSVIVPSTETHSGSGTGPQRRPWYELQR